MKKIIQIVGFCLLIYLFQCPYNTCTKKYYSIERLFCFSHDSIKNHFILHVPVLKPGSDASEHYIQSKEWSDFSVDTCYFIITFSKDTIYVDKWVCAGFFDYGALGEGNGDYKDVKKFIEWRVLEFFDTANFTINYSDFQNKINCYKNIISDSDLSEELFISSFNFTYKADISKEILYLAKRGKVISFHTTECPGK